MTKYSIFLILLFFNISAFSQSLNGPESIDYHTASNKYLISNSNNGQIISAENINGIASNLSVLVNGVGTGPHGLEVIGNTVWACSGGSLKAYEINSGSFLGSYNIGAIFLNGITHKGNDIFITDFSAKKIYRFDILDQTHHLFTEFPPGSPNINGILYDYLNDKLIVVGWGANAPIWEVSISDSSITNITNTPHNSIDGIAMDSCGNYYISVWGNNAIYQYSNNFTTPLILLTNQNNPADIHFHGGNPGTLAIPNSGNNSVNFLSIVCVGNPLSINEAESIYRIDNDYIILTDIGVKKIYNISGQLVWKGLEQRISKKLFNSGLYIISSKSKFEKIIL